MRSWILCLKKQIQPDMLEQLWLQARMPFVIHIVMWHCECVSMCMRFYVYAFLCIFYLTVVSQIKMKNLQNYFSNLVEEKLKFYTFAFFARTLLIAFVPFASDSVTLNGFDFGLIVSSQSGYVRWNMATTHAETTFIET